MVTDCRQALAISHTIAKEAANKIGMPLLRGSFSRQVTSSVDIRSQRAELVPLELHSMCRMAKRYFLSRCSWNLNLAGAGQVGNPYALSEFSRRSDRGAAFR